MTNRLSVIVQRLQMGWIPYAILAVILGITYSVLALRGFNLGFYGDVVAYQYHYTFDGLVGGMNWLIAEHWERHLLGAWFSAPLHMIVPHRYDLWYALTLGLHVSLGMMIFLLVDTLQSGQRRWLAFAVAFFFVFDTFQTPSNLEFATGSHRKGSLILALISLWAYIHFIRSKRQQLNWYILNVGTFILAIMIYEQSFFFFVLHPLIALVEERHSGDAKLTLNYLWVLIRGSILHVMTVLIYTYLLVSLFVDGNDNLELTPAYILSQIRDGLQFQFSPIDIAERLSQAIQISPMWFVVLVAGLVLLFFGAWIWHSTDDKTTDTPWTPLWLIAFGLLLMLLNLLNASPTVWTFDTHSRLIYASSIGTGMVIFGFLAWITGFNRKVGSIVFAIVLAIFLSPGIPFLYEYQEIYLEQDETSNAVYQAIYDAIPRFADNAEPYLILITDVHPDNDLALHPQDFNFPRVFALHYNIENFRADAVLYDVDESLTDQLIQLTDIGIISPLRPDEIIDYTRVIVISYDSVLNTVTILDDLPDNVLARGNFDMQAGKRIETNYDLLP